MDHEKNSNSREIVTGVVERQEFIEQMKQMVTVDTTGITWMNEVLEFQEQLVGKPWWQFTPDDIELLLQRLRADQERTQLRLRGAGGFYEVRLPKRVARIISDEVIETIDQFYAALETSCSHAEFTVKFVSEVQVQEWLNDYDAAV